MCGICDTTNPDRMHVTVEVWPVAADKLGLWLLSGDGPWPTPPILANAEPHIAAELELIQHQVPLRTVKALHSTSWRAEGTAMVTTYLAVVDVDELVLESWPDARPISAAVPEVVGPPPPHGATEPPAPRYWDVLLHGLRHLRYLLDTNAAIRAALAGQWTAHLAPFEAAIARMYETVPGSTPAMRQR